MTIPTLTMFAAALTWFLFSKVKKLEDGWAAEFAKVVFAAAVLIVLYGLLNKAAF